MRRHFLQAFLFERLGDTGVVRLQLHLIFLQLLVKLSDITVNEIINVITQLNLLGAVWWRPRKGGCDSEPKTNDRKNLGRKIFDVDEY